MKKIKYSTKGEIAIITLDNPPLNTFGYELRSGMVEGIEAAASDPKIKAIVLIGTDQIFSAGADITEFGSSKAAKEPNLRTIIDIIENSSKPVIVAIGGTCLGGGLEISLGCHYRVAKPDASLGLPEVKIGLLPGAGGTQRLPRLIGIEKSLNMIISGNPVPAEKLQGTPLIDEIISGDLLAGAVSFAEKIVAKGGAIKRTRDVQIKDPLAEPLIMYAKNTVQATVKNLPAPLKCVEAVEAAFSKPFDVGMKLELEYFLHLMQTPESSALLHIFFSERIASKIPDIPENTPIRKIEKVAVIGSGTMGGGISMSFLNAGFPVVIVDVTQEALDKGIDKIMKNYASLIQKGKMKPEQLEQIKKLMKPTISYEDLKDADLIIEAVFEDIKVKEGVFRKLDTLAKPGAILASNTSTLDLNKIASFTKRPQDVIGMHFFVPANIMKLLEVVRGKETGKDVLATVMQLSKKIKKVAVVSGVCDGFIGNRMIGKYANAAKMLLEEGASPQQIDKALEKWGMAMGPFRMGDLSGNDVGWLIRKRHYAEHPDMKRDVIGDRLCEMGRFGQKTGAGWYQYKPGERDPIPDPIVDKIIEEGRKELGITPRKISEEEIVQRCIYQLTNEGARILEEGIAIRASDIDIIYIYGYGFPVHRGGPMLYADTVGLFKVLRSMKSFGPGEFWEPAPLLKKIAEEGKLLSKTSVN